jgi:hypothetical protein
MERLRVLRATHYVPPNQKDDNMASIFEAKDDQRCPEKGFHKSLYEI